MFRSYGFERSRPARSLDGTAESLRGSKATRAKPGFRRPSSRTSGHCKAPLAAEIRLPAEEAGCRFGRGSPRGKSLAFRRFVEEISLKHFRAGVPVARDRPRQSVAAPNPLNPLGEPLAIPGRHVGPATEVRPVALCQVREPFLQERHQSFSGGGLEKQGVCRPVRGVSTFRVRGHRTQDFPRVGQQREDRGAENAGFDPPPAQLANGFNPSVGRTARGSSNRAKASSSVVIVTLTCNSFRAAMRPSRSRSLRIRSDLVVIPSVEPENWETLRGCPCGLEASLGRLVGIGSSADGRWVLRRPGQALARGVASLALSRTPESRIALDPRFPSTCVCRRRSSSGSRSRTRGTG